MPEVYSAERLCAETRISNLLNEDNLYGAIVIALNYSVSIETKTRLLEQCVEQKLINILNDGVNGQKRPTLIKSLKIRTIEKFLEICLKTKGATKTPSFIVLTKHYKRIKT
jgi:tRNA A37 threonylcarbamoyladenosine dehydratase